MRNQYLVQRQKVKSAKAADNNYYMLAAENNYKDSTVVMSNII